MAKVGDLVRLKQIKEVLDVHAASLHNIVGLVMEWNLPAPLMGQFKTLANDEGDGFVLWNGHRDWDIQYGEDLEVVNEA